MSKKKQSTPKVPHPFKHVNHTPDAVVLSGDGMPPELATALAEHVIGHRITRIEFTRELDSDASAELGTLVDNIDVVICLDNNVAYCCRLVVNSLAVVSRGEALATILPGDEAHTPR